MRLYQIVSEFFIIFRYLLSEEIKQSLYCTCSIWEAKHQILFLRQFTHQPLISEACSGAYFQESGVLVIIRETFALLVSYARKCFFKRKQHKIRKNEWVSCLSRINFYSESSFC